MMEKIIDIATPEVITGRKNIPLNKFLSLTIGEFTIIARNKAKGIWNKKVPTTYHNVFFNDIINTGSLTSFK